ncbi:MAG: hypothetical protein IPN33_25635 [Saprospiraceae bacterium]|nr:hypothetical protein [Saprospiraceae bacterium]
MPVVDIPGGGGGAVEIIDITYADMATAIGDATLTPGQFTDYGRGRNRPWFHLPNSTGQRNNGIWHGWLPEC